MDIIEKDSEAFRSIGELLDEYPDATEFAIVAGIDCDNEDIKSQKNGGDNDPMVAIELYAQWNPNTKQGILDWYFVRESTSNNIEPKIEHGGALIGFNYSAPEPLLDSLLDAAIVELNRVVSWAEFQLDGEIT